jgi:uroporphyrin-III C-methyltransferase / precorrin-2 dehydrogenase / sirohydrochlorin ferrochelatase
MPRILYPLAVDLRNKPVLVVGAGPVAARKLAELIRCGAHITVVAPEPGPGVLRLENAISLKQRPFQIGDELGRYLVFACTNFPDVNAQIAALCHSANILCNVADDSESGTFHVPGVVRQGDVTLTVSTGGSAPGLTRHLKRMLTESLGMETAQLASILNRFRIRLKSGPHAAQSAAILESLPYRKLLEEIKASGPESVETFLASLEKRSMVEAKNQPAFDQLIGQEHGQMLRPENLLENSKPKPSTVFLIGAGPGHPGLLTVLAAETLSRAQVIIHDRLIPAATLHLAPSDCILIPAGKRGHFESARQEDIEAKLVEQALQGKRVVRLKGGDPFVFGRGWEEVLALEAHGIPWSVIPGVSSTIAGPAWAGIPLTHRGVARSYAVMSGMAYSETNTVIPHADTIVLLMGLHRLKEIVPAFMAQGWDAATPVAAIENATLPDQRVCRSNLSDILAETTRLGFDSPTLLIIGKVVGLAKP